MLNSISLVGRLTRDPEIRQTNSGTQVGNFTIACDEGRKDASGNKITLFMDCSVFGGQAETLGKFFHKGNLIALCGRLSSRKYVNSQNVNVTAYFVNCDHIEFVESTAQMNASNSSDAKQAEQPVVDSGNLDQVDVSDDSLPF